MSSNTPVGPGTRVDLRFSLLLETGEKVDSTGEDIVTLAIGDGNLLPTFERAMFGMVPGDSASHLICKGFGDHNPENIQQIPRSQFGSDIEVSEGLVVSFADAQNGELPGIINKVEPMFVEVDFNHTLAGRDLVFEVDNINVEHVSNDIIRV